MPNRHLYRVVVLSSVCIVAAAICVGCERKITDKNVKQIGLTEVIRLTEGSADSTLIADTRNPAAFADGHIPGARNIPFSRVPIDAKEVDSLFTKPKVILIYGENAGDADPVTLNKRLLSAGVKSARLFKGGMAEWLASGRPVEKGD